MTRCIYRSLLAFIVCLGCLPVAAWQAAPTFTSDVRLVWADIQVRERGSGRVVDVLSRTDFELRDNGIPREIAVFESETLPLDVVLVLDVTGEIGRNPEHEFYKGLQAILDGHRDGDRIAVISVGSKAVEVRSELTNDLDQVKTTLSRVLLDRLKLERGEPLLYESIRRAASLFGSKGRMLRRRAIVAVTHNQTKPDQKRLAQAVEDALEADATVMGIVVPAFSVERRKKRLPTIGGTSGTNPYPPVIIVERPTKNPIPARKSAATVAADRHSIDPVADETGGEVLRYEQDMVIPWSAMMQRLRSRYMAGFYLPGDAKSGESRSISVRLTSSATQRCADCLVRARARYKVP